MAKKTDGAQVKYIARTGLTNADGERVEIGETLPDHFVNDAYFKVWLRNGDVILDLGVVTIPHDAPPPKRARARETS